ncbi:MAG: hypothetical protein ACTSXG_03130 [Alphaproteobacteria bacterium]
MVFIFIMIISTVDCVFAVDNEVVSVDEFQQQSSIKLKLYGMIEIRESEFVLPENIPIDCREKVPSEIKCPNFPKILEVINTKAPKKCFRIKFLQAINLPATKYVFLYDEFEILTSRDSSIGDVQKYTNKIYHSIGILDKVEQIKMKKPEKNRECCCEIF